jgi:hypothetical protein
MIEAKNGNVFLFAERTASVGDVAVCICVKTSLSSCALHKLNGNCHCCAHFVNGSEESALCFSMYLLVKDALSGSPLAVEKSKVGDVRCGYSNGSFYISWNVKGTGSAVRKSLGMAFKQLSPAKLFPVYSQCIKLLGGKAHKEEFLYVADKLTKEINSGLHCGIVGNIRLTKVDSNKKEVPALDLRDMLSVLVKKLSPAVVSGSKKSPNDHEKCEHGDTAEVKVSGWQSFVLSEYIKSKAKGCSVIACDKHLWVNMPQSKWDTLSAKLKDSAKDYAERIYGHVKKDLPALIGYFALTSGNLGCHDVYSMLKSNLTVNAVGNALHSNL